MAAGLKALPHVKVPEVTKEVVAAVCDAPIVLILTPAIVTGKHYL